MAKMNVGRIVLGGLLAGLILTVGEFLLNEPILGEQFAAAMGELGVEPPGGGAIGIFVAMTFLLGILIVWLYAAMRPRFGPGPKTAAIAGFFVWLLGWVWSASFELITGMFPANLIIIGWVWGLAEVLIAALAGAWLYREGATQEAAPSPPPASEGFSGD